MYQRKIGVGLKVNVTLIENRKSILKKINVINSLNKIIKKKKQENLEKIEVKYYKKKT